MAARRQPPLGGAPLRIPVDYLHGRQPPSGVLLKIIEGARKKVLYINNIEGGGSPPAMGYP